MATKKAFWTTMGLVITTTMGCTTILDIDHEYQVGCGPNKCQGGASKDGKCQPVIVASDQAAPTYIVVDATNLYWTNRGTLANNYMDGAVMKMPICGGSPTPIAINQYYPRCIAVDATNVYWTNRGEDTDTGGMVMMAGIDGSDSPTTLATGQNRPYDIVVNDESIFWTNESTFSAGDGTLMRLNRTESSPTAVASGLKYPQSVVVDATNVYWTDAENVTKAEFDGTISTKLAPLMTSFRRFSRITMNGTDLYWTNTDANTVMNVGTTGSKPVQLAASPTPFDIAADATTVYWTSTEDGGVNKVAIEGGAATKLASTQKNPIGIAVDAATIYWANAGEGTGDGTVMKLTK